MYLTEKEKKYCEYVFLEQAKSVKRGLAIVGVVMSVFLIIICIAMVSSTQENGTLFVLFTVIPLVIIFLPLFIWKSRTYDVMYRDLLNGRYQVMKTILMEKDYMRSLRPHRKGVSGAYFRCQGIDGMVLPLSMDLFDVAKEGDQIAVVKFESCSFMQGIIMSEAFDRKIWEWEQKNR